MRDTRVIPVWFLVVTSAFASLAYLQIPLQTGERNYHYMGQVVAHGGVPNRNFVEIKGPVGLIVYSIPGVLFGPGQLGYRFFDLGILLLICYLITRLANKTEIGAFGWAAALIWFFHHLDGEIGDVTSVITVAALMTAVAPERTSFLALGAIAGGAAWVKQTSLLVIGPVLACSRSLSFGKALRWVLGAFLSSCVVVLLLWITDALIPTYEAFFLDPILEHAPGSHFFLSPSWEKVWEWIVDDWVLRGVGIVGAAFMIRKHPVIAAGIVGSIVSAIIQGRYWDYHFDPGMPFAAIGVARLISFLPWTAMRRLAVILILLPPGIFLAKVYADPASALTAPGVKKRLGAREALLKVWRPEPEDTLYVLGDVQLYLDTKKITACRFANPPFVLWGFGERERSDHRKRWRAEIFDCLQRTHPTWVALDIDLYEHLDPVSRKELNAILESHSEWGEAGGYRVFEALSASSP